MTPTDFARAIAHGAAAELLRHNIQIPAAETVGVAIIEDAGVRIVVSITRYEGPARLHPTPLGAKELGVPLPPGVPTGAPPVAPLTRFHKRVLEVLDTTPKKGSWIAARIGAKYDGNFRAMIAKMVKLGLIEKRDGYAKPL